MQVFIAPIKTRTRLPTRNNMTSYVLAYPYPDTPPPPFQTQEASPAGMVARTSQSVPLNIHTQMFRASSIQGFLSSTIAIEQGRRQLQAAAASIHNLQVLHRHRVDLRRKSTGRGSVPVLVVGKAADRRAGRQRLPGRLCHFAILQRRWSAVSQD